jgi:hypothetical protein
MPIVLFRALDSLKEAIKIAVCVAASGLLVVSAVSPSPATVLPAVANTLITEHADPGGTASTRGSEVRLYAVGSPRHRLRARRPQPDRHLAR